MVPTPVGNLNDMAPRSAAALASCDLILAEDTRTSSVLLNYLGVDTPMMSHHKFNEHDTLKTITDRLDSGETICMITDAGTPGISDPGFLLSRECRRLNITVETIPGPTAFVPALVNSGLPTDRFCFVDFFRKKKAGQPESKRFHSRVVLRLFMNRRFVLSRHWRHLRLNAAMTERLRYRERFQKFMIPPCVAHCAS